ncbi:L-fucose:H+ symporter permease [Bacteroidetes bacterium SCGC AAA795-G10]|nr:L-fucose:H+ symporter permease [Bacteroidetes bacterium SCGC AAA795-G10]
MNVKSPSLVSKQVLVPFILVTSLFALWGFANDITNPMVAAFGTLMELSNAKAAWVQLAFYGGYATMAIPAAIFVRRFNYKNGIILGLALYSLGALLFYPAAKFEAFGYFLISLYILTFGLAFLETTASPYIMSMGEDNTATRRLNLAQAFNPFGSLLGMFVASNFILSKLKSDRRDISGELLFNSLGDTEKAIIRTHDLSIISMPYIILGFFVAGMLILITITKMPNKISESHLSNEFEAFKRLFRNANYREGVIAQMFYVGAQIMCWTFIIQYADKLGIQKAQAQNYNILAMSIFLTSRFLCTYLMKFISSKKLLTIFAAGGIISIFGVIFIHDIRGLYFLIATSAFMSLMFPTIYGLALHGLGNDTSLGAAGLVMAIVGGALMPPLQGWIVDFEAVGNFRAVNISFVLPLICFCVIAAYGYRTLKVHKN